MGRDARVVRERVVEPYGASRLDGDGADLGRIVGPGVVAGAPGAPTGGAAADAVAIAEVADGAPIADGPEPLADGDAAAATDVDTIERLGDEITVLAAQIHAITQRFLAMIAEFDRLRGWELAGYRDCAHWLSVRTGIDRGAAQEKVRAARALVRLPLTREAMGRGELSFSKVRALTRKATPESERELLELARGVTTAQLERTLRAWEKGSRQDEAARERERHEARCPRTTTAAT
jgi:hypothetical protein